MKIKHLFLALVVFSLAFVSCKKDEAKPQNDNRTPVAMRNASGQIINMKSVEDVQSELQQITKDSDRFVLESYSITEPTSQDPWFITIDYIDVEEEDSYSISLIGDYVEEVQNYIYLTKDVENGNFSFKESQSQSIVKYDNGQPTVIDDPTPIMQPGGIFVSCRRGDNCKRGSCRAVRVGPGDYTCSDCEKKDSTQPSTCKMTPKTHSGTLLGLLFDLLRAL